MKLSKDIDLQIDKNRIKELEKIFPEVVNDGVVDFNKFKKLINSKIDEQDEESKFGLQWFGKRYAEIISKTFSKGTLRPSIEESKNWENTENIYIEGDNLEVLKLVQKSYANKIDVIYIDPPYNTGKDFIYKDDFKESLKNYKKLTNQIDDENNNYSTNKDDSGRYHSNWLSMMYPRLKLARNLLKEDGVIFISIDDNEQARLKLLCDEIFGESNFVSSIIFNKKNAQNDAKEIEKNHEYILVYKKTDNFKINKQVIENENYGKTYQLTIGATGGGLLINRKNLGWTLYYNEKTNEKIPKMDYNPERVEKHSDESIYQNDSVLIENNFIPIRPPFKNGVWQRWTWNIEKAVKDLDKIIPKKTQSGWTLHYVDDRKYRPIRNESIISSQKTSKEIKNFLADFPYPKSEFLIQNLISKNSNRNALILDFFSGSATTAHAVMKLNSEDNGNRKFIMIQIPEKNDNQEFKNICEIGKERIRRAGQLILKENNELKVPKDLSNLDIGFRVLKLDTSNIKESNLDVTSNQLSLFENNIIEDRVPMDLLFESIIKLGFTFDKEIVVHKFNDNIIYIFGGGILMACFDKIINIDVAKEIVKLKKELNPEIWKVIFLDNGFESDKTKINAKEIIRASIKDDERYNIKDVFNTI